MDELLLEKKRKEIKEEQTTKVNIIPNIETNTWTKISWENIKPIENIQNVSSWKLNNQIENKTYEKYLLNQTMAVHQ